MSKSPLYRDALISRENVTLKIVMQGAMYDLDAETTARAIMAVQEEPPVMKDFIRCGQCKHWDKEEHYCCDFMTQDENGFCSWAERREE